MLGEINLPQPKAKVTIPNPSKGKNQNLCTNKPCTSCGVYGHYTHECPLLPEMHHMWEEVEATKHANSQPTPPSSSQPIVLRNPFPTQGFVSTIEATPSGPPPTSTTPWEWELPDTLLRFN
jgi:hypothetical protein